MARERGERREEGGFRAEVSGWVDRWMDGCGFGVEGGNKGLRRGEGEGEATFGGEESPG